jgi:hypothetical protein
MCFANLFRLFYAFIHNLDGLLLGNDDSFEASDLFGQTTQQIPDADAKTGR